VTAVAKIKRRLTWAEVQPMPRNPVYPKRVAAMRRQWGGYDDAIVGSPAIADNAELAFPELPAETPWWSLTATTAGSWRSKTAARITSSSPTCTLGLTRAEAHRTRRGLNDRRTVKPAERFIELVAEGDIRLQAIQDTVEGLGWRITYEREDGGLSCTNELEWIWDQKGGKAAMIRAITSYERIWGEREDRAQARVIKGLGAFWLAYPKADPDRLVSVVRKRGTTVNQLYVSGRHENDTLPYITSVYDGVRYVLAQLYNRGLRTGKLAVAS
jgi:hypothetical protein